MPPRASVVPWRGGKALPGGVLALGPRGDNWRWGRRGPRDPRARGPRAPPHRHCGLSSPQRPAPSKPETWEDSEAGPLAFLRIQAEYRQASASHLQRNNS